MAPSTRYWYLIINVAPVRLCAIQLYGRNKFVYRRVFLSVENGSLRIQDKSEFRTLAIDMFINEMRYRGKTSIFHSVAEEQNYVEFWKYKLLMPVYLNYVINIT